MNCGNISSAVGPYAIDEGMVEVTEPVTKVRIFNTNTQKVIVEEVPVKDGRFMSEGDFSIDGVPGTASRVILKFVSPQGLSLIHISQFANSTSLWARVMTNRS